jgi:hypothetical protein
VLVNPTRPNLLLFHKLKPGTNAIEKPYINFSEITKLIILLDYFQIEFTVEFILPNYHIKIGWCRRYMKDLGK